MGVHVIPIPTEVVSHSHAQFSVLFPFPWDSRSHWESHSHAHLYSPTDDTRTVAEVVRLRSEPAPPATRSIETQTELTWPNNQETSITAPTSTCTSQISHT